MLCFGPCFLDIVAEPPGFVHFWYIQDTHQNAVRHHAPQLPVLAHQALVIQIQERSLHNDVGTFAKRDVLDSWVSHVGPAWLGAAKDSNLL